MVRDIASVLRRPIALSNFLGMVCTQVRMAADDNRLSCFRHLRSSHMGCSHLLSNLQVDVQDVVVLRQQLRYGIYPRGHLHGPRSHLSHELWEGTRTLL